MGETEHFGAYIVIHGPGHDGTRLALREGITSFGRLPSNDVILLGDLVSRHHSRITFFEGKATLQDLGSHNGSWVNGERVTTRVLKHGDLVRIGNFRLAFHDGVMNPAEVAAFDETTAAEGDGKSRSETMLVPRKMRAKSVASEVPPDERATLAKPPRAQSSKSILIDEIERVRAGEAEIDPGTQALMLLYRASEALAKAVNLRSYLNELLTLILEQVKCDHAAFFRAGGDGVPELLAARDKNGDRTDPPISMSVVDWVVQKNFPVMAEDVTKDMRFEHDPAATAALASACSVVCVPLSSRDEIAGAIYISRGGMPFSDSDLDGLSAIAHLSVVGLERAEVREQAQREGLAREMLARFHSPEVVDQLLKEIGAGDTPKPFLDGKTATVMFCDIQGFTALTERLAVDELSEFLNTYLEQMSDITLKHRGTIDKFMGGSMMSVFGAPFSYGNDAGRAVAAALEMRDAFDALVRSRPHVGPRRLRVGINTGWVLAGIVGFQRRLEYTALGDTVTAASRLEASAAPGAILIGEATYPLISEIFDVRKLGLQQIRGRYEPMQVYEVLGRKKGAPRAK